MFKSEFTFSVQLFILVPFIHNSLLDLFVTERSSVKRTVCQAPELNALLLEAYLFTSVAVVPLRTTSSKLSCVSVLRITK